MIQENFSLDATAISRRMPLVWIPVVRMALDLLRRESQQRLQESADLYSEIYADEETQELTAARCRRANAESHL